MTAHTINLAPHVRELKLIAGTGCGKTLFASNFAAPAAQEILARCVGETNSTILDRLMVFTTDDNQSNKMTVAVKHNRNAVSYSAFRETLAAAAAGVIQRFGTADLDLKKLVKEMREALETELGKKNNLKAVFSLLTGEGREEFLSAITDWYQSSRLWESNARLYNTAKNQCQDRKPGKSSPFIMRLIKTAVLEWLDQCSQEHKDTLQDIYDKVNQHLSQRFFDAFRPDDCSADGYYYHDLDLQNPDEAFCRQMFTSNNMQSGEGLSLEILCSEIVIYIPMAAAVADMLRRVPAADRVFSDPRNNLVFGLRDTQGLFHADRSEDENFEYCSDLVYKNASDAILVIAPLWGDPNGKKTQELYRHVLQGYQKDTPIFLIHNKLDLFVDTLVKNMGQFNALTGQSTGNAAELTLQEISGKIQHRIEELNRDLQAIRKKGGKHLNIYSDACFLKELNKALSCTVREEIAQSYNLLHTYQYVFTSLAGDLELNAEKLAFEIDPSEDQAPSVDTTRLQTLLNVYLNSPEAAKLIFDPGTKNLGENEGVTPHGNSYHALGRRLWNGEGNYKSNIDESYYYNCRNINITFPSNIKHILAPQFLHTLVFQTLTLKGGTFKSDEEKERFLKAVEVRLCSEQYRSKLINKLLYQGAFLKASSGMTAFSFRWQFQAFLDYSRPLLTPANLDENAYTEALCDLLQEAGRTVMSLHVVFI